MKRWAWLGPTLSRLGFAGSIAIFWLWLRQKRVLGFDVQGYEPLLGIMAATIAWVRYEWGRRSAREASPLPDRTAPFRSGAPSRVFISYSSKDAAFVKDLAERLRASGVVVWLDSWSIKVGDPIASRIGDGLKDADFVIVVLSRNAVSSKWVNLELNTALWYSLQEGGGPVLPVVIDDCEIPPPPGSEVRRLPQERHACVPGAARRHPSRARSSTPLGASSRRGARHDRARAATRGPAPARGRHRCAHAR